MPVRAVRFNEKDIEKFHKSDVLKFLTKVTGYGTDVKKFIAEGLTNGRNGILVKAVHTREGRRTMQHNLAAMSDQEYGKAKKSGSLEALRLAWGLDSFKRLDSLRSQGYPDQREQPKTRTAKRTTPTTTRKRGRSPKVQQVAEQMQAALEQAQTPTPVEEPAEVSS